MTEIRKILSKDNLKYYIERMLNDKQFKKDVIKNCVYVNVNIAIADPNSSECYVNTTLGTGFVFDMQEELENAFNKYIEQGTVVDFLDNCRRLEIIFESKTEDIRVEYTAKK